MKVMKSIFFVLFVALVVAVLFSSATVTSSHISSAPYNCTNKYPIYGGEEPVVMCASAASCCEAWDVNHRSKCYNPKKEFCFKYLGAVAVCKKDRQGCGSGDDTAMSYASCCEPGGICCGDGEYNQCCNSSTICCNSAYTYGSCCDKETEQCSPKGGCMKKFPVPTNSPNPQAAGALLWSNGPSQLPSTIAIPSSTGRAVVGNVGMSVFDYRTGKVDFQIEPAAFNPAEIKHLVPAAVPPPGAFKPLTAFYGSDGRGWDVIGVDDSSTGIVQWRRSVSVMDGGGFIKESILFDGQSVFFQNISQNNNKGWKTPLVSVEALTGEIQWENNASVFANNQIGKIVAEKSIPGVIFFLAAMGSFVGAFSARTGDILWSEFIGKKSGTWSYHSTMLHVDVKSRTLVVGADQVYRISAVSGKILWKYDFAALSSSQSTPTSTFILESLAVNSGTVALVLFEKKKKQPPPTTRTRKSMMPKSNSSFVFLRLTTGAPIQKRRPSPACPQGNSYIYSSSSSSSSGFVASCRNSWQQYNPSQVWFSWISSLSFRESTFNMDWIKQLDNITIGKGIFVQEEKSAVIVIESDFTLKNAMSLVSRSLTTGIELWRTPLGNGGFVEFFTCEGPAIMPDGKTAILSCSNNFFYGLNL